MSNVVDGSIQLEDGCLFFTGMQGHNSNSVLEAPLQVLSIIFLEPPFSLFLPVLCKGLELLVDLRSRVGDDSDFRHLPCRNKMVLDVKTLV
jgi:hypothetical protein